MSYEEKIKECENIRIENANVIQDLLCKLKDSVEKRDAKSSKEYAMQVNKLAMKNIESIQAQNFYEKRLYDRETMENRSAIFHLAIRVIRNEIKKIKEIIVLTFGNKRKKHRANI